MSDRFIALIRTVVPVAVGSAVTWTTKKLGVQIDTASVAAAAVTVSTGAYYFVASSLERKWSGFGILLGVPAGTPTYSKAAPFEDTPPGAPAFDLKALFPAGTVIQVPGEPAPAAPMSFTVTFGPDGPQITPIEPAPEGA